MKLGTMTICDMCGAPIRWQGQYWEHTTYNPRHIARPAPPFNVDVPIPPEPLPSASRPDLGEADQILVDLGSWASAALDDPQVCDELKAIFTRVVDYAGSLI